MEQKRTLSIATAKHHSTMLLLAIEGGKIALDVNPMAQAGPVAASDVRHKRKSCNCSCQCHTLVTAY